MNILRVVASMDPAWGGPAQGVCNSVLELEKFGVYNEVVSLDDPSSEFISQYSFLIHPLGPTRGPWKYTSKLESWLHANIHRFDVIIIHGIWSYYSYAVNKIIQQYKRRVLSFNNKQLTPKLFVMPHGMLDPWFQQATTRRLKAIRNWCYWKLIESKVIKNADGLLFTCETELLLARKPFRPYSPKREINIGYGINKAPDYTHEMRNSFLKVCPHVTNHPFILFLSRIHEKKGVDLLIGAYSSFVRNNALSASLPKLVIAGPGLDTSYGQKIQQMVYNDSDLTDRVYFTGMINNNEKWGAFYTCEAFILPSHQENFGISVVEALACSKPVLISDQINIWREIEGEGGGIVATDSLKGVEQMLLSWLNLPVQRKKLMSDSACQSFEKYFSIKPATSRLLNAIQ